MLFRIENTRSGLILGEYEADSEKEALDLLAQDAGYKDYADLDGHVPAQPGELKITVVRTEV